LVEAFERALRKVGKDREGKAGGRWDLHCERTVVGVQLFGVDSILPQTASPALTGTIQGGQ